MIERGIMRLNKWLLWALICPIGGFAQELFEGTVIKNVQLPQIHHSSRLAADPIEHQDIALMQVHFSDTVKHRMVSRFADKPQSPTLLQIDDANPSAVDLGMDTVPVLNQGIHGSCVTFAATAAIDAILKKGDYVSQLCSLQLGRHIQSYGYVASGWEGGLGAVILAQIEAFGFMTKNNQREIGCGHLTEYPLLKNDLGQEMVLSDFHQYSESMVQNRIGWSNLVDIFQSIHDDIDGNKVLNQVKQSLIHGDRLIFGVLLADYDKGLAGAVGAHKVFNDTWVITPEIINDLKQNPQFAGHEMLIVGYDDNAIAKDENGREYRGLIKVRNSWGDRIGDQGNFYMSYDYFRALVIELQRIRQIRSRA